MDTKNKIQQYVTGGRLPNFFRLLAYYLELDHESLEAANKDLLLAASGKDNINHEVEKLKRVEHRFKELL